MKKKTYTIVFGGADKVSVRAFTAAEATILAQAEQIKAGKEWRLVDSIVEVPE